MRRVFLAGMTLAAGTLCLLLSFQSSIASESHPAAGQTSGSVVKLSDEEAPTGPGASFMPGIPCGAACIAPDNGSGTVDLPAACPYVGNGDLMYIIDGLPPGATVEITPELSTFTLIVRTPGGTLGGEILQFNAILKMSMFGTGVLTGFARIISVPVQCEIHTAPRMPFTTPQSFDANLMRIQGQITGDPDFDLLRITAGNMFGLPSPGHTTLTQLGGGSWAVDSFFDITYRIDFIGAPGGGLAGMSGSTTGTIRMQQGFHHWTTADGHIMHYPQYPVHPGWDVNATVPAIVCDDWRAAVSTHVRDIHFWGSWFNGVEGTIRSFDIAIHADIPAGPTLPYSRPGTQLWRRTVDNFCALPLPQPGFEGWYDPALPFVNPANHTRIYQYDIELDSVDWFLQSAGTIYWICISANLVDPIMTRWGWHSSSNHFLDDAVWGQPIAMCIAPDNGSGTATMVAQCPFGSTSTMDIINGLPPGSTIECAPTLTNHFGIVEFPGGSLLGTISQYQSMLLLNMAGTGAYAGYLRNVALPMQSEVHHGPRTPGLPLQSFPGDYRQLQGQIVGDPDFDLLRITGGTGFGMPSPGHTTLTQLPGGNWAVDSFFDITYRIDFVGRAGGPFSGMSGSTTGTIRIQQGGPLSYNWNELYEPPLFTTSMDMAFVITGRTPCDCRPGDANGSGGLSIADAVWLINYIFAAGPAPTPYTVCSGDADCNCAISIADAVYIINYIFSGGPAPCGCGPWSLGCGTP